MCGRYLTHRRLTGLLSFMLSDEMTTGSVTTTVIDKKAYAIRSHAWNIANKKFREAFPDVSAMSNTLSFRSFTFSSLCLDFDRGVNVLWHCHYLSLCQASISDALHC